MIRSELVELLAHDNPDLSPKEVERIVASFFDAISQQLSDGGRIELRGSTLYAVTAGVGKGIQVVDLEAVRGAFDTATGNGERTQSYWQMQGALNGSLGFAQPSSALRRRSGGPLSPKRSHRRSCSSLPKTTPAT